MLQMSGKMWTAPLPAEPLRLENAFLEVRGSPDRIRKAHSVCFSFLFLPCLAAVTPPCPPQNQGPIPSLPLTASHSPFVFDSWEAFYKLLLSAPSLWNTGKLPARSLAPAPHRRCWQQLATSLPGSAPPQEPRAALVRAGQEPQPPSPLLSFTPRSCAVQGLNSLHSNCFMAPTSIHKMPAFPKLWHLLQSFLTQLWGEIMKKKQNSFYSCFDDYAQQRHG